MGIRDGAAGRLAGADRVYDAVFEQYGVIRARDVEDLFDLANVCATPKYPKGNRTAIITISGGAASLIDRKSTRLNSSHT